MISIATFQRTAAAIARVAITKLVKAASLTAAVAATAVLYGCDSAEQNSKETQLTAGQIAQIQIANPSDYPRRDQAVTIPVSLLGIANINPHYQITRANQSAGGAPIAHQWIDDDGDGTLDSLLLITDLAAAEEQLMTVSNNPDGTANPPLAVRTAAEISRKTGGAWEGSHYRGGHFENVSTLTLPENYTDHAEYVRYEGPGIESEQVGYRLYIDWRNGIDVFAKTATELVLHQVGQDGYDSYHEMSDWGMDVLKVGSSAGIGGFGWWDGSAVQRLSEVEQRSVDIVASGPLYSAFKVNYQGWSYQGRELGDLTAQLSMHAGSRLVRVDLNSSIDIGAFAVTLPKHSAAEWVTGDLDITGKAWSYAYTFGPQAMNGEPLANFVLFRKGDLKDQTEDEHNFVHQLTARDGHLRYYFGAIWGAEDALQKGAGLVKQYVTEYLKKEAEKLTLQPRLVLTNQPTQSLKAKLGSDAVQWSTLAAHSEIKRHGNELAYGSFDSMRGRLANWEYTTGLLTQGVYQQGQLTGDKALQDWAQGIIDSYIAEDHSIHSYRREVFNIDSINSGKMLLQLYRDSGDQAYRDAAAILRDQLVDHPRQNSGAYWHKKRYPSQLWLDGVYMGMPFLAEYSVTFEQGRALDAAVHEFAVVREELLDPQTGLYWHAWDESRVQSWADPETGLSHYFWARGMGWLAMAIVDTLQWIPTENSEQRQLLIDMAVELADTLLRYQRQGVWYQIVDRPDALGNYKESSASAMFTYFLAKGVADGVLPERFKAPALDAYQALLDQFVLVDADGDVHLTQAVEVGGLGFGRDGSYDYYMSEPVVANDPKVLGPFIMLGRYISQLQQ